jgi:hypothetical protein
MTAWGVRLMLTGVVVVALMGLVSSAGAQQIPGSASPLAACGPDATQFKFMPDGTRGATAPTPAGKATVYVIELDDARHGLVFNRPPVRIGMDGAWIGAMKEYSHLQFPVEPGTQHVCARWSHRGITALDASLLNFDTEAGKTYYLRLRITTTFKGPDFAVDLQPVSDDEGRFLVSETFSSVSEPK